MREMASLASAYDRQQLPASLMQRLEMMQQLALAAQANAGTDAQRHRRGPRRGAQAIVLAWFSLGVLASGALGAGTIVAMRAQAAGGSPLASIVSLASMDWAAWANAPAAAVAPQQNGAWDTIGVAMRRAERVPLPVRVTSADGAAFEVVIDGLPVGVRPSRGAPRGPSWVLGRDDLDGLFLTLDKTAPAAFDVKVAVSVPSGVVTAGSIVRVRLIDAVEPTQVAPADGGDMSLRLAPAYTGMSDGPEGAVAGRGHNAETPIAQAGGEKAKVGREGADPVRRRAAPTAAGATGAQTAGRRSWPEGASALGAVTREPDGPSWWQMAPPSWSPFVVGQERP